MRRATRQKGSQRVALYPPGDLIAEELEARGWSQEDLARITGRPLATINEIIKGKKSITPETALDLAEAFGTSPELWLGLEGDYRLARAAAVRQGGGVKQRSRIYSLVPLRELQRRRDLSDTSDLRVIEGEVCGLLRIQTLEQEPDLLAMGVAARKSGGFEGVYTAAQVTWLFLARRRAETMEVSDFRPSRFVREVAELPKLSANEKGWKNVKSRLADWGIRLVLEEHLSGSKIDGALFWLSKDSPVIALSLRYDRVDHFWFTLMHELGHLHAALKGKQKGHVDANLVGPQAQNASSKPPEEREADRLASEWLIPQTDFNKFVRQVRGSFPGREPIIEFAMRIGLHPGIVVGRLQYEQLISYSQYRDLLLKVRNILLR